MRLNVLHFMLGRAKAPEGFPAALAATLSLADPAAYFNFQTEAGYYFLLEEVRGRWATPSGASEPSFELYRDKGARAMQNDPIDLRLVGTPGEVTGGKTKKLRRAVALHTWFEPKSIIQIKVTGYIQSDPTTMKLAALGRYVLAPT